MIYSFNNDIFIKLLWKSMGENAVNPKEIHKAGNIKSKYTYLDNKTGIHFYPFFIERIE